MNREFLETLLDETYEMAYANSEKAILLREKILEKIDFMIEKETPEESEV